MSQCTCEADESGAKKNYAARFGYRSDVANVRKRRSGTVPTGGIPFVSVKVERISYRVIARRDGRASGLGNVNACNDSALTVYELVVLVSSIITASSLNIILVYGVRIAPITRY